jgi:uncharacterized protein YbjT (DUF2867 family)
MVVQEGQLMAERNQNKARPILVTGATGKQGGAALRHLRQRGYPVRGLTRNPDSPAARSLAGPGVEVVRGDFDDPASISRALEGVYGVFSVQDLSQGPGVEIRWGKLLADLAQRAEVSHFVYTSVGSADQNTGVPHFESKWQIELHLRNIGIPHTVLRPVFFMENFLGMADMLAQGVLALPLSPERTLQLIAVGDIGAFAALAFEHPGQWMGKAMDLAGDELSMEQIAASLGRAAGREVRYQQIPWEQFEHQAGAEMTIMARWFQDVGYHADIAALRSLYQRLTPFPRWVQEQDWNRVLGARSRTA